MLPDSGNSAQFEPRNAVLFPSPKFLPTVIIIFLLLPPSVIVLELTLFSLGVGATGGIGGGRREIVVAAESTSFH